MYGVYTVFLAGKLPNIARSYTVHIYGIFGRETTKYSKYRIIYGAYIWYCWQGNDHI